MPLPPEVINLQPAPAPAAPGVIALSAAGGITVTGETTPSVTPAPLQYAGIYTGKLSWTNNGAAVNLFTNQSRCYHDGDKWTFSVRSAGSTVFSAEEYSSADSPVGLALATTIGTGAVTIAEGIAPSTITLVPASAPGAPATITLSPASAPAAPGTIDLSPAGEPPAPGIITPS